MAETPNWWAEEAPNAAAPSEQSRSRARVIIVAIGVLFVVLVGLGVALFLQGGNEVRIGVLVPVTDPSQFTVGDRCDDGDVAGRNDRPANVGVRTADGEKFVTSLRMDELNPPGAVIGEISEAQSVVGCLLEYSVQDVPDSPEYDLIVESFPGGGGALVDEVGRATLAELRGNLWYTLVVLP